MVGHAAAGTGRLRRNGPPSARPDRRGGTAEGGARAWSGTDRGRPDLRALVALPVGGVESGRTRLRGRRHHLGGPGAALADRGEPGTARRPTRDRKRTRLNSSHVETSYAVFCLSEVQR